MAIQVVGIGELEGTLHWQDGSYLALSQAEGRPLTLIYRSAASTIRALG